MFTGESIYIYIYIFKQIYIYICFILLFTSSSSCRKDQFAVSYFSTSTINFLDDNKTIDDCDGKENGKK